MAWASLIPAILSGAAAIFGGEEAGPTYEYQSPRPTNNPMGASLEPIGQFRATSTLPFTAGANRTIDYGRGLPSTVQQTPQFMPAQGQSTFNANYGGGYSPGQQGSYQNNTPFNPAAVNPIYGNANPIALAQQASGGGAPQQQAQGQGQSQGMQQQGQNPQFGSPLIRSTANQQQSYQQNPQQGQNNYNPISQGTSTPNPTGPGPGSSNVLTDQINSGMNLNTSMAPPGAPSAQHQQAFAPDIFRDPFVSGLNASANIGSFAAQAAPGAGMFQSSLYDPNLNAHETNFLTAGANLGLRGLESAFNQINSQYENTPFHAGRSRQMYDAANQFGDQMMRQAGDMGMQRQSLATQNLPNAFNAPLQANQYGQQSSAGLYNLFDNAMYGDLKFPFQMYTSHVSQPGTYLQTNA